MPVLGFHGMEVAYQSEAAPRSVWKPAILIGYDPDTQQYQLQDPVEDAQSSLMSFFGDGDDEDTSVAGPQDRSFFFVDKALVA